MTGKVSRDRACRNGTDSRITGERLHSNNYKSQRPLYALLPLAHNGFFLNFEINRIAFDMFSTKKREASPALLTSISFLKKEPKNFLSQVLGVMMPTPQAQADKSLFASFSSEKEVLNP